MRSSRSSLADLGHFSDPSLLILSSLANAPKHGYAMMADIEQFCWDVWTNVCGNRGTE